MNADARTKPSFEKARQLFSLHRADLAASELRGLLVDEPHNATTHAFLAMCLLMREAYGEAEAEITEALRLDPELAYAHFVRSRLFDEQGNLADARSAIQESIRLNPTNADWFYWLASCELALGHAQQAIEAADHGLELDPQHVGCLNARSMGLAGLGLPEQAAEVSRQSLARDPVSGPSYAAQGWNLLQEARYDEAKAALAEALRLDPTSEWAWVGHYLARRCRLLTAPVRWVGERLLGVIRPNRSITPRLVERVGFAVGATALLVTSFITATDLRPLLLSVVLMVALIRARVKGMQWRPWLAPLYFAVTLGFLVSLVLILVAALLPLRQADLAFWKVSGWAEGLTLVVRECAGAAIALYLVAWGLLHASFDVSPSRVLR